MMIRRLLGSALGLGLLVTVLLPGFDPAFVHGQEAPHGPGNDVACSDCHNPHGAGAVALIREATQEATCRSCHAAGGSAASMADVANHVVDEGALVIECGVCHNPHRAEVSDDPHDGGQVAPNLSLVRSDLTAYLPQALDVAVFQQPEHLGFDEANPPWNGICQVCHTSTDHHTNDDSADHDHWPGFGCTHCHRHENGFAPATCADCHDIHGG